MQERYSLLGICTFTCSVLFVLFVHQQSVTTNKKSLGMERSLQGPWRRLSEGNGTDEYEVEPAVAVLFPFVAETMGIITLWAVSRFLHLLPYTALLFVEGVVIGVVFDEKNVHSEFMESVSLWVNINPELLLLVFLPALIFGDAIHINWHMFVQSFWQIWWLAFPMVLVGTLLTGVVLMYIFPHENMTWAFALTVGSILSATDPVSVSSLLNESGGPNRLKMLIQGESMLNDGSAMVFFKIFSAMYLFQISNGDIGEEMTVGKGFAIFFQMSLGGICIGVAFGLCTLFCLWMLDRKLNVHDIVLQVSTTITAAYLSFYVAEMPAETSGVLGAVFCGLVVSAFGMPLMLDLNTLEHVWSTIEHLGNTLLFVLAGVVFGSVVTDSERRSLITGADWGWMILLYVFCMIIRVILFLISYPFLKYVGLSTSIAECVFSVWGGLRGGVGLALALSVDNYVRDDPDLATNPTAIKQSTLIILNVGGVALLTLVVNGTLASTVLKGLGLTNTTTARVRIVQCITEHVRLGVIEKLAQLLGKERFACTDLDVLRKHVPILVEVTEKELEDARERLGMDAGIQSSYSLGTTLKGPDDDETITEKELDEEEKDVDGGNGLSDKPASAGDVSLQSAKESAKSIPHSFSTSALYPDHHKEVHVDHVDDGWRKRNMSMRNVVPPATLSADGSSRTRPSHRSRMLLARHNSVKYAGNKPLPKDVQESLLGAIESVRRKHVMPNAFHRGFGKRHVADEDALIGLREVFVEILRNKYWEQIQNGEMQTNGFVDYSLLQSLEIGLDNVAKGRPINDWAAVNLVSNAYESHIESWFSTLFRKGCSTRQAHVGYRMEREMVFKAFFFVQAHRAAEVAFKNSFGQSERSSLTDLENQVLEESRNEVALANKILDETEPEHLKITISHLVASILLYFQGTKITKMAEQGLLKQKESQVFFRKIQKAILEVRHCNYKFHSDIVEARRKRTKSENAGCCQSNDEKQQETGVGSESEPISTV